ncbi:oxidoreductase [Dyella sp. C11]|uniref:oxidoreductase n=1 Tax=Dyella sp. C11 TaxID=2126991 RepID=UPI000D653378|nr:oxidoreductase [Dyella sp. C11]
MRTWFVTGAARGFGARIVDEALARGDNIIATSRDPSAISDRLRDHPKLFALKLDVTNQGEAKEAVSKAIDRYGRIDVLVNNAGYGFVGAVEEASPDETLHQFETNVFGLLAVTRAILPQMRHQRSGHVINMSAVGGYSSYPGWGIYCATKFAIEGLSESLALELKPLGIHVTVVEPGFFRTDFLDNRSLVRAANIIADYDETAGSMRGFVTKANHTQPGDPSKLAKAILALVDADQPPVRLPLGADAIQRIEEKNRTVEEEIKTWRNLSTSTDI